MSNLEDLVPPLDLCRKIPDGCFEDSAMVYAVTKHSLNYCFGDRRCFINDYRKLIPAPTLQEIFAELADGDEIVDSFNPRLFWNDFLGGWILECRGKLKQKDGVIDRDELRCRDRKNPATAALKLWLEVNKLDRTDKTNKTNEEE